MVARHSPRPSSAAAVLVVTALLAPSVLRAATPSPTGAATPSPTGELQRMGRDALRDGRTHDAVDAFEACLEIEPDVADHHYWLGLTLCDHVHAVGLLQKLGVAKRLKAEFEEAIRLNPGHVGARIALIEFHRQAPEIAGGDPDESRRHASELLEANPVEGRIALARMLLKYGERRAAERHVRHLLGIEPGRREPRLLLATMQVDIGRHSEALAILGALLREDPNDLAAAFQYGRALALSGSRLDQAEETLLRVAENATVDDSPSRAEARWLLATVYEHRGEVGLAADQRQQALAIDPSLDPSVDGDDA